MSYVDNAITVGICLGNFGGMYSVEPVPGTPLRSLAEIRCGTICIISRFAVPCWGCFCMRMLHFSAVATVAACMVSAIALPWLFGKLIRLCRLDDIFKKIGLPA